MQKEVAAAKKKSTPVARNGRRPALASAPVARKSTASSFTSRASETLIVEAADMRHATRLAALQVELQLINEITAEPERMAKWLATEAGSGRAPRAIVRNGRAARYRMPRRLKRELMDRFCAPSHDDEIDPPSVMIVAAHQDDESVGAGSRLFTLTDVYVVHVTDGAPQNPEVAQRYGFATREEYADARRAELMRAMEVAGVPKERMIELGYMDGEAAFRMVDLVMDIADLVDTYAPDIIITHPYEGGHTDHDATAFAVHFACGLLRREGLHPPAVLEMTSYHDRGGQRVVHEFLPHGGADRARRQIKLSKGEEDIKRQMYECFSTQKVVMSTFSTAIEKFRPAPRYVFTRPPHEGRLNYEKYGDAQLGSRWRHNAEQALSRLGMRST